MILKRGLVSLFRQPVKTFILFLTIILLTSLLMVGFTTSLAMSATKQRLLMRVPAVAILDFDPDSFTTFPVLQPSTEELRAVGELPYVRMYDLTLRVFLYSQELIYPNEMDPGSFIGIGVNNPAITDIESGLIQLYDGRVFTQEEINGKKSVMIIPLGFAEANNLSVGSVIGFSNLVHDLRYTGDWSNRFSEDFVLDEQKLSFEVIGIYTTAGTEEEREFQMERSTLYVPFGISEGMRNFERETLSLQDDDFSGFGQATMMEELWLDSFFILNDARLLNDFIYEADEILPEGWFADGVDETIFTPILSSMNIVENVALLIQWGAFIGGILVLYLIMTLFLKDRGQEIGTYMALGDKKRNIRTQILLEMLIITSVALMISFIIGYGISEWVSRSLLQQTLVEQLTQPFDPFAHVPWQLGVHIPHLSIEEILTLTHVDFQLSTLIGVAGLSLTIVIVSTLISIGMFFKKGVKNLIN